MSIKTLLTSQVKQFLNLQVNSIGFPGGSMSYETEIVNLAFDFAGNIIFRLVKFTRVGDCVVMTIPRAIETTVNPGVITSLPIPVQFRPNSTLSIPLHVSLETDVISRGTLSMFADGSIQVFAGFTLSFAAGPDRGWPASIVVAYNINDTALVDIPTTGENVVELNRLSVDTILEFTSGNGVIVEKPLSVNSNIIPNTNLDLIISKVGDSTLVLQADTDNSGGLDSPELWMSTMGGTEGTLISMSSLGTNLYTTTGDIQLKTAATMNAQVIGGRPSFSSSGISSLICRTSDQKVEILVGLETNLIENLTAANMNITSNGGDLILNAPGGDVVLEGVIVSGTNIKVDEISEATLNNGVIITKPLSVNSNIIPNTNLDLVISKVGDSTLVLQADTDNSGGLDSPEVWMTTMGGIEAALLSMSSVGANLYTTTGDILLRTGATMNPQVIGGRPSFILTGITALTCRTSDQKVEILVGLETNLIENRIATDMNITSNGGDLILNAPGGDIISEGITVNGTGIKVDEIRESTPANSVEFPDNLKVDIINERTGAAGVTVDGVLVKDNSVLFSPGQTALDHYTEVTHVSNITGIWAVDQLADFELTRIGRVVTMTLEFDATAVANAAALITIVTPIPADYRPSIGSRFQIAAIEDNTVINAGSTEITSGGNVTWGARTTNANFAGAGNSGLLAGSISWSI